MVDLTLTTFNWVPQMPRGYLRDCVCVGHWRPDYPIASRACHSPRADARRCAQSL
jgi:hypothetical protein